MKSKVQTGLWFWLPIVLLVGDGAFLSYFWVWNKDVYFPNRSEEAFAASGPGLVVGAIGFAWLVVAIVRELRARRSAGLTALGEPA